MAQVIEQAEVIRDYGFKGVEAIINHPKHGLILVADGFGYRNEVAGGAVRWEHGVAARIKPGDTLDNLSKGTWNEGLTLKQAVLMGLDDTRPMLALSGSSLSKMVVAAGL